MKTISPNLAHQELVTAHQTMKWETSLGRLTVRKTSGRYVVRLEDYGFNKVTVSSYATLKGALIAAETLRSYYL